uniref:Uncharacterized protein n=1 Tax=viral metagenome TaxID=1070528 RepID=A0A6C0F2R2_9ZZZZ
MSSSLSSFPSFYIPRVFKNIGEERVIGVFESLGFGCVDRVDFVRRRGEKGDEYNSVYVHFASMNDTNMVRRFLDKLQNGGPQNPPRVVYDDPWFWIVLENKPKQARVQKAYIEFQGQGQSQGYSLFGANDFPPLPQMLAPASLNPAPRSVHFQFPDIAFQQPAEQPDDQAFVSADYANYLEMEIERLQGELDALRDTKEADDLLEEAIAAHYAQGDDA